MINYITGEKVRSLSKRSKQKFETFCQYRILYHVALFSAHFFVA